MPREPVLLLGPHPVAAACQQGKLEIPAPETLQESRGTCISRREGPWQRQVCERQGQAPHPVGFFQEPCQASTIPELSLF